VGFSPLIKELNMFCFFPGFGIFIDFFEFSDYFLLLFDIFELNDILLIFFSLVVPESISGANIG